MLTADQIKERKKGIGSSDARVIACGTDQERYDLWREKTGRYEPGPILSPWDALLRHYVEPALMDFYGLTYSCTVTRRAEAVVCRDFPILRATLDGANMDEPRLVDAKLLNLFTPDPETWLQDKYGWQMVHQMTVCEIPQASLYVSLAMKKPVRMDFSYNEFEALEYVDRCRQFWSYVENDKEPPGAPPPLAPPMAIADMREVDMTGNNEWGSFAAVWLDNRDAAKAFDIAADELKKRVEKDVRLAYGHGIEIKRDGRGLKIKERE